jgi:hypothetical protein
MNTAARFNVSHSAAVLGETIMITCKTEAYPPATCHLYRNGNWLTGSGYILSMISSSDLGPYNCSCTNRYGSGYGIGTLTLYGMSNITLFKRISMY